MLMVVEQAEAGWLQVIQAASRESAARCVQIFAQPTPQGRGLLRAMLPDLITKAFSGQVEKLFFMVNGEIWCVVDGVSTRQLEGFLQQVGLSVGVSDTARVGRFYELGFDRVQLLMIAEEQKVNAETSAQQALEMQKQREAEQLRQRALNPELEAELRNSLVARRDAHEKTQVLVVEDDLFSIRLVTNALRKEFIVHQAKDGRSAVESYLVSAPHIVFLDIELPDVSGHEILHKLRAIDPQAFIVMLSGNADKVNIMKAISDGAKGFIAKPFTREKLLQYITLQQQSQKHKV